MGLDLASKTGYAIGSAGSVPRSGTVRLRKRTDDLPVAPSNLGCWLRDIFARDKPDLIVFEAPLPFFAKHDDGRRRSYESIVLPPMLMGALLGVSGPYGVPCRQYQVNAIRKRFLGRASFGNRAETKGAVLRQAKLEKLIPEDCYDDNRADAVAVWMVGSMEHAHHKPAELVMFEEASP